MIEKHKTCPKCGEQVKAVQDDDLDSIVIGRALELGCAYFTFYYPCKKCQSNIGWETYRVKFKLEDATTDD